MRTELLKVQNQNFPKLQRLKMHLKWLKNGSKEGLEMALRGVKWNTFVNCKSRPKKTLWSIYAKVKSNSHKYEQALKLDKKSSIVEVWRRFALVCNYRPFIGDALGKIRDRNVWKSLFSGSIPFVVWKRLEKGPSHVIAIKVDLLQT